MSEKPLSNMLPTHPLISPPAKLKSVCVFCGSSTDVNPEYLKVAREFGRILAQENVALVYGGGLLGVMGAVATSVSENGGKVIGVIPQAMFASSGTTPGETIVVQDMHTRKAKMNSLADAFIALPGGFGTMEELLEIITWAQLSIHKKPVGVLNVRNFFGGLVQWVDTAVQEGFIKDSNKQLFFVEPDVSKLMARIRTYRVDDGVRYAMSWPKGKSIEDLI